MGNCISVCGSKDATADTGASREDVQRHQGRTNDAPVQDGPASRSNRNATAQRNAQLPPVTERELPVEGRTSRLVKRSDGTQSQYLLDGHDLFGTYSTASSKPAKAREERVVGAGAQTRVHERNNPNAPVLVKIARSAGENEEHTRRLDRLALMLATTPDREMAAHFAIEVRKGADDGKAVTLTRKVDGPSLNDYFGDPKLASLLPIDRLGPMLDELQKAVTWLNQRGYAHGDIAPDNIVIDVNAGKLVLIDFGCAKDNPGDDDRDRKDFRNGLRRYVDFRVEADGERYRKAYAEAHSADGH